MPGPLAGVRVLDLTRVVAGPFATMILGDLGAHVIKVERPGWGDDARHMDNTQRGGQTGYFLGVNKNKQSVVFDLTDPDDVDDVRLLARWADVVVENFRAGVADRLGLGYDQLRAINPRLVYCSIPGVPTGDGELGDAARPMYDIIAQARSGIMHITGEADGPPAKCGAPIADISAGMFAVIGILAALHERTQSGTGQHVEASLLGASVALLSSYLPGRAIGTQFDRLGSAHNTLAPYQAFQGSDGGWFLVAAGNDRFWIQTAHAFGLSHLTADPRFATNAGRSNARQELADLLQAVASTRPAAEWTAVLQAHDVPTAFVNDLDGVLADTELRRWGIIREVEHPTAGFIPLVATPITFSETPPTADRPPPLLGQHAAEVAALLESLRDSVGGYSPPN